MNIKENTLASNNVIYLLLLPIFFYQVKIGESEIVLNTYLITIFLSIIILFRYSKLNINLLLFSLFFSIVSLVGVITNEFAFLTFKYILLLLPALIIPLVVPIERYSQVLINLAVISTVFSIIAFFMNIGVDYSYGGYARMQGFMSEPSAMSFPIGMLFVYGLVEKKKYLIFLAFTSLILSVSPTVVVVSTLIFLTYFISRVSFFKKIFSILLLIFMVYFSLDILEIFLNLFPDLHILHRIYDGLIYVYSGGEAGYNTRLDKEYFFQDYISYFGYGLNTFPTGRDWNIHFEVLYAFGIFGWSLFILLLTTTYLYIFKKNDKKSIIVFISVCIYASLNSAQGIIITIILYTYIMYFVKKIKFTGVFHERTIKHSSI